MSDAWYIDAWSILDGIAFASLRVARDWGLDTLSPSTTTIIIGPPDWRAVSISRVTTALRAAHGPFQESVFDDNDHEIAFATLEDIRDVVRRAYLAGGLGLDDPGGVEPVVPERPNLDLGGSWTRLHKDLLALDSTDARAGAAKALVDTLSDCQIQGVIKAQFDQLTLRLDPWIATKSADPTRDTADYAHWLSVVSLGLGLRTPRIEHGSAQLYNLLEYPFRFAPMGGVGTIAAMPPHQRMRLLFRLPALSQYPGYPRIRTLADQMLLAFGSRSCLRTLNTMDAFLPIVLGALVMTGIRNAHQLGAIALNDKRLLEPAMHWLANMLPPARDDKSAQEQMLETLIRDIAKVRADSPKRPIPARRSARA
jgi:hypothetical protein